MRRLQPRTLSTAFKRVLAPENNIPMVKTLYDIKGAQAYHNQEENDPESIGVRAIDDKTLVITLEGPVRLFLADPDPGSVQAPAASCDSSATVRPGWSRTSSSATAPTGWVPGEPEERLVFERRADFHGRLKGNLPRHEFVIMSQDAAIVAYNEDAIDGMFPFARSWEEGSRLIQLHPDDYQSFPSNGTLLSSLIVGKRPLTTPGYVRPWL